MPQAGQNATADTPPFFFHIFPLIFWRSQPPNAHLAQARLVVYVGVDVQKLADRGSKLSCKLRQALPRLDGVGRAQVDDAVAERELVRVVKLPEFDAGVSTAATGQESKAADADPTCLGMQSPYANNPSSPK